MRVRRASRKITRLYEEALRPAGITAAQFTLLVSIAEGAGRSISFLAETMGLERTTLIRNVQVLEKAGLVTLGDEGFRRQRAIELSQAGEQILQDTLPLWQRAQDQVAEQLGDDLPTVLRALERLSQVD